TRRSPLVAAPFSIDVNQIAVDSANNVYAAGNSGGSVYISRFNNGTLGPFTVFASGLGDTESIVVLRQIQAVPTVKSISPGQAVSGRLSSSSEMSPLRNSRFADRYQFT